VSYLDGGYLGGSDLGDLEVTAAPPSPSQVMPLADGGEASWWDAPVELPGGIVMPKRTLLIIAAVLAGAWYFLRR
jgi:hypothetical protein